MSRGNTVSSLPQGISTLRLALIGCGAVAERCYVPALARLGLRPEVVVDRDWRRAQATAEQTGARRTATDTADVVAEMDAAIVATPPSSHAEIGTLLLSEGVHVLLEKPMATSIEGCERLSAAAAASGAVLAVGLMRRHAHSNRWVKAFLRAGFDCELESLDVRDGYVFGWPFASDYLLHPDQSGGGVLADIGPHVLDLVLMWIGKPDRLAYFDDAFGGVEADCELYLGFSSGAFAFAELSRTRHLRNSAVLRGRDWMLDVSLHRNELRAHPTSLLRRELAGVRGNRLPHQDLVDLFVREIRDWLHAVATGGPPAAGAEAGTALVELVAGCYEARQPLILPWLAAPAPATVNPMR